MKRSIRKQGARGGFGWVIVVIAAAVLGLRCIGLEHRPVHGDEANQAYKTGQLLESGRYVYDPHDHHGPTLYFFALAPLAMCGVHSMADMETWMLRLVPVIFSAATLLLLIPLRPALAPGAGVCAALLLAVSPAFSFYSRYFIQESLLVFFTSGAIVFGWRYSQRAGAVNAIGVAVSLALMHATKETAILAFAAMAFALASILTWRFGPRAAVEGLRARFAPRPLVVAVGLALLVSVTLFSAFGTNLRGPLDSVLTYVSYFRRAGGAGLHDKPWNYYLALLWHTHRGPGPVWSEAVVLLLSGAGIVMAAWRRPRIPPAREDCGDPWFLRFVAVYTIALAAIYAAVPYKTPWSLLSFYSGVVLLAGVAAARGIALAPGGWRRGAVIAAFAVSLAHLALQTYRSETEYAADVRNPWVYAHTSSNLVELVTRIGELDHLRGNDHGLHIEVIQPDNDYWPLPWYLRRYSKVGYRNLIPSEPDADLIISSPVVGEDLREQLKGRYFGPSLYSLRPAVLRELYVRQELWDAFMVARVAAH